MRVKITYADISGEDLEKLMENEDIEKVEIIAGCSATVEEWLETHNIHGHAVAYAYRQFMNDNPTANMSLVKFGKAVKATGKYISKNMRIGDSVQRCFVALDGAGL